MFQIRSNGTLLSLFDYHIALRLSTKPADRFHGERFFSLTGGDVILCGASSHGWGFTCLHGPVAVMPRTSAGPWTGNWGPLY